MPYQRNSELPKGVKNNVPPHGQTIYRKAFNSAWDEYKDSKDRRDDASREEVSHRVAWAAVKEVYHKEGDQWVRDN